MAKPKGFAHHAKAAKDAHDSGDHDTANHHIGKMFGLNRHAKKGTTPRMVEEAAEEVAELPPQKGNIRGNFARLRSRPS